MSEKEDQRSSQQDGGTKSVESQIINVLMELPESEFNKVVRIAKQKYHSGPIPSPETFAGYESVLPGSAREILDMAIRQQKHDHEMDNKALGSEISYRYCTLISASAVVLSMIGGSIWLAAYGHDVAAGVLGASSGLTLLAGAFLKGRDLFPGHDAKSSSEKVTRKPPKPRIGNGPKKGSS